MANLTIFTDGGARSNPGPAGIGVVVYRDEQVVWQLGQSIGTATNNEAEYQAFLTSLDWVLAQPQADITHIVWKLDSKLVVEQLNKNWKVKEARLQVFVQQAWKKLSTLPYSFQITHVPREQNAVADGLYNTALDEAGS